MIEKSNIIQYHIALCEPHCSGKSGLAEPFVKNEGFIYVGLDEIRKRVLGVESLKDVDYGQAEQKKIEKEYQTEKALNLFNGNSIITDTLLYDNEHREVEMFVPHALRKHFDSGGINLKRMLITLKVDQNILKQRYVQVGYTDGKSIDFIQHINNIWEPVTEFSDDYGEVDVYGFNNNDFEDQKKFSKISG